MKRSLSLLCAVCWPLTGQAILFYDTADSNHNTSAPGGLYAGSGWEFQGLFGAYMGTAISASHFITAQHIGVDAGTFSQPSYLTGNAAVTHTIDAAANGGLGYWDVGGTDLRIYQITGSSFSSYAPLYTGSDEIGLTGVITGRGGPSGSAVMVGGDLKGWETGGSDGVVRWGLNMVSGTYLSSVGDLLYADFDALPGLEESHLSVGDSGGSLFLNDGGVWKLAGIHYAVDGRFSYDDTGSTAFTGALFDIGGLYVETPPTWTEVPDQLLDIPSSFYSSRISSSAGQIQNIIAVPEPGSALLGMVGVAMLLRRRRKAEF